MGLFGGARVKTNMAKFSGECHSADCSGDSKVLTELDSNKIKVTVLDNQKSREVRRIRRRVPLFIYTMLYKIKTHVNADMAK